MDDIDLPRVNRQFPLVAELTGQRDVSPQTRFVVDIGKRRIDCGDSRRRRRIDQHAAGTHDFQPVAGSFGTESRRIVFRAEGQGN